MEVLRDYSQIINKTQKVLAVDVSNIAMLDFLPEYEIEHIQQHATLTSDNSQIGELAELILQLRNYVPAVCNYVNIFLYMQNYDAVYDFISKLIVGHFGNFSYTSKCNNSFKQRLFDRFIEVIKTSETPIEIYLPLVFACIYKEELNVFNWREPAIEFMQIAVREDADNIEDFLQQNPKYELEFLQLLLQFDTQKAMSILFNKKHSNYIDENNAQLLLKNYMADAIIFFDKNLPNSKEQKLYYIKLLAQIGNNPEILSRFEDIYDEESDATIKDFLSKKLNITETVAFNSEKHFQVMAAKSEKPIQERSLSVAFANIPLHFISGQEANNAEKTYLINLFKAEANLLNLYGLFSIKNIFNASELEGFCEKLFNKLTKEKDINSAKWCVRMFSLFSSSLFERTIYEFLIVLYKLSRKKEALYLTLCLIYSRKIQLIEVFYRLENNEIFKQHKEDFLNQYALCNKLSKENIIDELLPDYLSEEEELALEQRLFNAFISGRKYARDMFRKLFISKPSLNKFGNRIVFGEYKQNKLCSIFVLKNKEIIYLFGDRLAAEDNPYIKMVHPIDLDKRFEAVDLYINNALFDINFKPSAFEISTSKSNLAITQLLGTIVNGEKFVKYMQKNNFQINSGDLEMPFLSLTHQIEELNLLTEVEFTTPITKNTQTATVGYIRFYKLNSCIKGNNCFILNKQNAINIGGVCDRYLEYILRTVQKSIKN